MSLSKGWGLLALAVALSAVGDLLLPDLWAALFDVVSFTLAVSVVVSDIKDWRRERKNE